MIDKCLRILSAEDIVPVLITPAPFALPNILEQGFRDKKADVAFVDLGDTSMNIFICRDTMPIFSRNISFGLQDIFQDIAEKLSVPQKEVEHAIREHGVPDVEFDLNDKVSLAEEIMKQKYEAMDKPQKSKEVYINILELRTHWQPHIDRIVQEIKRTLAFYKEQSFGQTVEKVFFIGGAFQIKKIVETCFTDLSDPFGVLLPFKGFQVTENQFNADDPQSTLVFANASALAASIPLLKDKRVNTINFVPHELQVKEGAALLAWIVYGVIILFIVLSIAVLSRISFMNIVLKLETDKVSGKLTKAKEKENRFNEFIQNEKTINLMESQIAIIKSKRINTSLSLHKISQVVPEQVLLKKLKVQGKKMEICGVIRADYENAVEILSSFRQVLESSGYFFSAYIKPLPLEDISADEITSNSSRTLTRDTLRDFNMTAEISGK
jgi:cell division ATPase FtsA